MFFTCSIRGDLWSMCKETGYNASFDSCRKLQKACCLSELYPLKWWWRWQVPRVQGSAGRSSLLIYPLVTVKADPWSAHSATPWAWVFLGKGGSGLLLPFFSSISPLQHLLGPSPRPQRLTLTSLSRFPSPLSFFPILFWDPIIL